MAPLPLGRAPRADLFGAFRSPSPVYGFCRALSGHGPRGAKGKDRFDSGGRREDPHSGRRGARRVACRTRGPVARGLGRKVV
jgi:hypothetical protein